MYITIVFYLQVIYYTHRIVQYSNNNICLQILEYSDYFVEKFKTHVSNIYCHLSLASYKHLNY